MSCQAASAGAPTHACHNPPEQSNGHGARLQTLGLLTLFVACAQAACSKVERLPDSQLCLVLIHLADVRTRACNLEILKRLAIVCDAATNLTYSTHKRQQGTGQYTPKNASRTAMLAATMQDYSMASSQQSLTTSKGPA